jgi:hypothetical protein
VLSKKTLSGLSIPTKRWETKFHSKLWATPNKETRRMIKDMTLKTTPFSTLRLPTPVFQIKSMMIIESKSETYNWRFQRVIRRAQHRMSSWLLKQTRTMVSGSSRPTTRTSTSSTSTALNPGTPRPSPFQSSFLTHSATMVSTTGTPVICRPTSSSTSSLPPKATAISSLLSRCWVQNPFTNSDQ